MRANLTKRGFTLIELLVVIAIIGLLAAILFPVFSKAIKKAKQTQCLSNIKQLTLAYTMFVNDNREIGPDAGTWPLDLEDYAVSRKLYRCPLDANGEGYISYALNGLLVTADGSGLSAAAINNPAEVGIFVDATSKKFPEAPVLNWAGDPTTKFVERHSYCLSYADGHAEAVGGSKNSDINSIHSPIGRAFYQAAGYKWITNPGGGAMKPTGTIDSSLQLVIGGSTTCAPLWESAAAGWAAAGGLTPTVNCLGSSHWADAGNHVGGASSQQTGMVDADIVATDAFGIIIPTTSKLNLKSITQGEMLQLLTRTGKFATMDYNLYVRKSDSGTYEAVNKYANGTADAFSTNKTVAYVNFIETESGRDMVERVSQDPKGIGYCGLGEADPTMVSVLNYKTDAGVVQEYDRPAIEKTRTSADGWALQRPLFAKAVTADQAALDMITYLQSPAFKGSLLFKSEFFPKKNTLAEYGM